MEAACHIRISSSTHNLINPSIMLTILSCCISYLSIEAGGHPFGLAAVQSVPGSEANERRHAQLELRPLHHLGSPTGVDLAQ